MMETFLELANIALSWIDVGIYEYTDTVFERLSAWLIVFYLEYKLWALEFAWAIASVLLDGLDISSKLDLAWGAIDSTMLNVLTFFKVPEGLNVIISAFTTRFVMDLI